MPAQATLKSRRTSAACPGAARPVRLARHHRARTSVTVSPLNSVRPVSISQSERAESPHVGRQSTVCPSPARETCTGGAEDHAGNRARVRECRRRRHHGSGRAAPVASPGPRFRQAEVEHLDLPSGVSFTLAGFRSRWTIPLSWAASSASATWRAIVERLAHRHGAAAERSSRSSPSTSSSTRARRRRPLRARGSPRCSGG